MDAAGLDGWWASLKGSGTASGGGLLRQHPLAPVQKKCTLPWEETTIARRSEAGSLPIHTLFDSKRGGWRYDLPREAKCAEESDR